MKLVLVAIIGILLWQSTDVREFTADTLRQAADVIEPDNRKPQSIGERIDNLFN